MKKYFLITAALFAALSLGFVSCENPDDDPGFSLESVGQEDADDKNDANSDGTTSSTPEKPTLIATGDVTDLAENSATFWGRLNADTLWALPNVKWGVEYAYDREAVSQHKHQETTKVNCTAGLQGANMDEFSVTIDGLLRCQTIYYSAYILINDMKYVYGELDSVHIVKLTVESNNSNYGTVTDCSGCYNYGSEATITATPKENCYFTGWSDSDSKELTCTVQVNSDTIITANFAEMLYLTVKSNNSNFGTLEGSGYYELNTEVTITATPNYYTEFVQWSDGNTENPRTVTVTSNVTYVAEFKVSYTSNFSPAAFSVSSTHQVYFSPGNLQYHPKNKKWRFAPSQLDYIGDGNKNISSTYNGWLDLFGWGTGADPTKSIANRDFYKDCYNDWGRNKIGSDAARTWSTLNYDGWKYLLLDRPNASSLRGVAQVNGVNGLILLPDAWTCPDGITFKSGFHSSYGASYYAAYQTFTADQWSKMEAAGAVFLPAAGRRYHYDKNHTYNYSLFVQEVQYYGNYWSSSSGFSDGANRLYFGSNIAGIASDYLFSGFSVRLVKFL